MLDLKLEAYAESGVYPFHMPGHKRNPIDMPNPYTIDITEIDGFDNLHAPDGLILEAQERAARLYGSAVHAAFWQQFQRPYALEKNC